MSDLVWFKSSYSGGEGGQCIEVAHDWHKSSYSQGNGECVEVATHPDTVHVRDSKHISGPVLDLTPTQWAAFVEFAALSA
ncbi:DUF397 domain-containing protein [Streptomyces halobius]|uniref:DUF397 domain-containing protein n=1 Tax=Streptomyces halobius TaxID=2879846 RepID=A0ABY4MB28_9ACTN|nr:DUF397 domain-containing protein [Streptomyces halobius]UQA93491.1 DUF397 domain-containing protein [Streptomyces halobius]